MSDSYAIEAGEWTGLSEPAARPGWPERSPVLVEAVVMDGEARMRLDIVQPLHPGGGRRRRIVADVTGRTPEGMTCLFTEAGATHMAQLARPNREWLKRYAPWLPARRPRRDGPCIIRNGERVVPEGPDSYLQETFGRTVDEVLQGASRSSLGRGIGAMPEQHARLRLDALLAPFDSALVARGFTPRQMEDKWVIFHEAGHLLFARSWTGTLIYDVAATWHGERLHLGEAIVNRLPDQYKETDDARDLALLRYLVDVVLRGVRADFPHEGEPSAEAALRAWSAVGDALLR